MSDGTKQAVQRFTATLLAMLAPVLVAMATSAELRDLIFGTLPSTVAGVAWLILPPLLLGIAKAVHGPTQVPAPAPDPLAADNGDGRRRARFVPGKPPGIFG